MQQPQNAMGALQHEGIQIASNTQTADEMRATLGIEAPAAEPETPAESDAGQEPAEPPEPVSAQPQAPAPETPDAKEAKPKKKNAQERINELTYEREEAKREAARLKADYDRQFQQMREDTRREIESLKRMAQPKTAEPPKGEDDPEPQLDQFASTDDPYASYLKAHARWGARQEFKAQQQQFAERQRQDAQARAQFEREQQERQRLGTFTERMEGVFAKAPEMRAQLESVALTRPMWDVVLDSDIPDQILGYLAQHPEKAQEIASLPALHAFKAVSRIEYELDLAASATGSAPAPKTTAHPPVSPVSGSHAAPASGPPGPNATTEEHFAYYDRLEQEERAARRR